MQFPFQVLDNWEAIGNQFVDASVSTALTIPALPAGDVAKGAIYVAILSATAQAVWLRTDGVDAVAAVTGGVKLVAGDWRVIKGYSALKKVRFIRDAGSGALAVEYFYYRK